MITFRERAMSCAFWRLHRVSRVHAHSKNSVNSVVYTLTIFASKSQMIIEL